MLHVPVPSWKYIVDSGIRHKCLGEGSRSIMPRRHISLLPLSAFHSFYPFPHNVPWALGKGGVIEMSHLEPNTVQSLTCRAMALTNSQQLWLPSHEF